MKTVIITGASSGFGKSLTEQLSKKGTYTIIATLRNANGANKNTRIELEKLPNVVVKDLDVTKAEEVQTTFDSITNQYSQIDVLVNNAGTFGGGLMEGHSVEQVQKMFDVNFFAPFRTIQSVLPQMRKQKNGLIINLSSMLGFFSIPLNAIYSASKFALEGLVTGSYHELLPHGVENILIEPGSFPTELYQKAGIKADIEGINQAYSPWLENTTEYVNKAVWGALEQHQPNPQAVVQKMIDLIEMPAGTRPLRNPIDHISGDAFAQKVANDIEQLYNQQMKAYGF